MAAVGQPQRTLASTNARSCDLAFDLEDPKREELLGVAQSSSVLDPSLWIHHVSGPDNHRKMHEHIRSTTVLSDKTKALIRVEPLLDQPEARSVHANGSVDHLLRHFQAH